MIVDVQVGSGDDLGITEIVATYQLYPDASRWIDPAALGLIP